jgi:hypothetical protein
LKTHIYNRKSPTFLGPAPPPKSTTKSRKAKQKEAAAKAVAEKIKNEKDVKDVKLESGEDWPKKQRRQNAANYQRMEVTI